MSIDQETGKLYAALDPYRIPLVSVPMGFVWQCRHPFFIQCLLNLTVGRVSWTRWVVSTATRWLILSVLGSPPLLPCSSLRLDIDKDLSNVCIRERCRHFQDLAVQSTRCPVEASVPGHSQTVSPETVHRRIDRDAATTTQLNHRNLPLS